MVPASELSDNLKEGPGSPEFARQMTVSRFAAIAEVLEIDLPDLFKNPCELLTQPPPASPEINSSNNGVK